MYIIRRKCGLVAFSFHYVLLLVDDEVPYRYYYRYVLLGLFTLYVRTMQFPRK